MQALAVLERDIENGENGEPQASYRPSRWH